MAMLGMLAPCALSGRLMAVARADARMSRLSLDHITNSDCVA